MVSWWTQDSIDAFSSRTQCFVEEYSQFDIVIDANTTLKVNGQLTLGASSIFVLK